jgi:glycosyltransferase involved in cell wall biosynthesis
MVLTRAFACALPVVASDIPGYREVLEPEASVAVPPSDPEALGDAVTRLVADEPRRAAMGEAARAIALARYSWSGVARRLEQIYVSLVEGEVRAAA